MKKKQPIDYSKMTVDELAKEAKKALGRIVRYETKQKLYDEARKNEYSRLSDKRLLKPMDVPKISGTDDLWKLLGYMGTLPSESIVAIVCTTDNAVCDVFSCTTESSPESATTDPDYIAKRAKEHNADYIYIAHNHPSGVPRASSNDIWLTRIMETVCNPLNIRVKDHLIVTLKNLYSIRQRKIVYRKECL